MAKLVLSASPTFTATVLIPVPGKKAVPVEFTYKGRTKEAFREFADGLGGRDEIDLLMDIIVGWELEDEFSRDNVEKLSNEYMGASKAIIDKYVTELTGAKLGN